VREADTNSETLHVCVDARLVSGQPGGTQQVVIGLAHGLSRLEDGLERYSFLVMPGQSDWLEPYLGGACRLLPAKPAPPKRGVPARALRRLRSFAPGAPSAARLAKSDGTIEASAVDIMHFPLQTAFVTPAPSIYHPHDLQHLHYPEFFTRAQWKARELEYRAFCAQAAMIPVTSQWNRNDLLEHYSLREEKVVVIPLAPAIGAYHPPTSEDLRRTRARFELPGRFILYPAQTWAHKNHARLVEAIARLRDEGRASTPLVCSGTKNDYYRVIARRVRELDLAGSVLFTGFVEPEELNALYQLSHCVVVPTLFEAAGGFGPIAEAFLAGRPVACSNVTSLPDEVGDAALVFDPLDVADIAGSILRLWTDPALCDQLVERGRLKVAKYDWVRTARIFRAHYRRIAERHLTDEDVALLAAPAFY
jgi:glycosyltransferase involved in cell wall biosynthesis